MRPGYYFPVPGYGRQLIPPQGVRETVERWVERYGSRPPFCGRIRVHRMSSGVPIWYALRGPVYIGPVPAGDVLAWPGCELLAPVDLLSVYVRDGGGDWRRELNVDPLTLADLCLDYGDDYERWPDVLEIDG